MSEIMHLVMPKMSEVVMNSAYRMFPDSPARRARRTARNSDRRTKEAMISPR